MNNNIHPISFSIHESKIIDHVPENKLRLFSVIIPKCGVRNWTQFLTEKDYYDNYKTSVFGHTCKKAGWDCMRHYEIIANGCMPYFYELDKCPKNTLTTFPKQQILDGMTVLKNNLDEIDWIKYNLSVENMMQYFRNNCTTKKTAQKFLEYFETKNIKSVLVLTNNGRVDYLYNSLLIGLKELLGINCIDYPRVDVIYDSYPESHTGSLYGRGYSYSRVLPSILDTSCDRSNIINRIEKHEFDLIINTYDCRENNRNLENIISHACKFYKTNDIAYVCGCDCEEIKTGSQIFHEKHHCSFVRTAKDNFHIFIRELGDDPFIL